MPTTTTEPTARRARTILTSAGATLVLSLAACSGGDGYRSELIEAMVAQDGGLLSPSAERCIAEVIVDEIGPETLRNDGITADNVGERLGGSGSAAYLDPEQGSLAAAGCMTDPDLGFLLAPSLDDDDIADFECAVGIVGTDTARDAWRATIVAEPDESRRAVAVAADDCRGRRLGDAASQQADTPPTTVGESAQETTTTTEPEPVGPVLDPAFAETPPIIAVRRSSEDANGRLNYLFDHLLDGPGPPYAYLENAAAASVRVVEVGEEVAIGALTATRVAVLREATAVSDAEYAVLDTATGDEVDSLPFDQSQFHRVVLRWSPDARAFVAVINDEWVLHRVGAGTAPFDISRGTRIFASDDTATSVVSCTGATRDLAAVATVFADGTTDTAFAANCRYGMQAFDEVGNPYALITADDGSLWRLEAGREAEQVVSTGEGYRATEPTSACDDIVAVERVAGSVETVLYDMRSGNSGVTPTRRIEGCPAVSPDRSKVAYRTNRGTVELLEFATNAITEVASAGEPWAFSADSETLLVEGGGTFLVNIDGSGGVAASVQAVQPGGLSSGAFCRAGYTGRGLMHTEDGIGIYDIDTDNFTAVGIEDMPSVCFVTPDGRWILAGSSVVDVENRKAMQLHQVAVSSGARVVPTDQVPGQRIQDYMWHGPQHQVQARRVPRN